VRGDKPVRANASVPWTEYHDQYGHTHKPARAVQHSSPAAPRDSGPPGGLSAQSDLSTGAKILRGVKRSFWGVKMHDSALSRGVKRIYY
jgi:hypothetical protein